MSYGDGQSDIGRYVLRLTVQNDLGRYAGLFDIPGIVEEIIERHGFVDLAELSAEEIFEISQRHPKT